MKYSCLFVNDCERKSSNNHLTSVFLQGGKTSTAQSNVRPAVCQKTARRDDRHGVSPILRDTCDNICLH